MQVTVRVNGDECWNAQWHCRFCARWTWNTMVKCATCYSDRHLCEGPSDVWFGDQQYADKHGQQFLQPYGHDGSLEPLQQQSSCGHVFGTEHPIVTTENNASSRRNNPQSVDWLELARSEKSASRERNSPLVPAAIARQTAQRANEATAQPEQNHGSSTRQVNESDQCERDRTAPLSSSMWLGSSDNPSGMGGPQFGPPPANQTARVSDDANGSRFARGEQSVSQEQAQDLGAPPQCARGKLHRDGLCKPCKYFSRRDGCELANQCAFCHLPHLRGHPGTQWRPSKEKRKAFQRAVAQVCDGDGRISTPARVPAWIASNPFLARKLEQAQMKAGVTNVSQFGAEYLECLQ